MSEETKIKQSTPTPEYRPAQRQSAIAAFLLAFWVADIFIRTFVFEYHGTVQVPGLGPTLHPGREVHSDEGYGTSIDGENGFLVHPDARQPNGNIVLVGDSYTKAEQLPEEQSFFGIVSDFVQKRHLGLGVVNTGFDGGDPALYIYRLSWMKANLKPRNFVFILNEGDFTEDLPSKAHQIYIESDARGDFVLKSRTKNQIGFAGQMLVRNSMVYYLAGIRALAKDETKILKHGTGSVLPQAVGKTGGQDSKTFVEWTVRKIKADAPNSLILFVPVIDYFKALRKPTVVENELLEACRRWGQPFHDLRQEYADSFSQNHIPCHGFVNSLPGTGHINSIGHSIAATYIESYLQRQPLPREVAVR